MLDGVDNSTAERIPSLEEKVTFRWSRFLLVGVIAIGGALVVTGLIDFFQLYPKIPNISFVYLLLILLLASTLGRYAAVLDKSTYSAYAPEDRASKTPGTRD